MRELFIGFIKAYQWVLSPLMGSNCRFSPTCSSYTIEAINTYGSLKGIYLGIKRIVRCHPGGAGGYDPVP